MQVFDGIQKLILSIRNRIIVVERVLEVSCEVLDFTP